MKIGVLADTHSQKLPSQMLDDFKHVDMIVHAGDFCSLKDLNQLKKIKEVKGVCGNMDDVSIQKTFPLKIILTLAGHKIGVVHGSGSPKTVLNLVQSEFAKGDVECVVFGHSHHPVNEVIKDILYFNPGSPTDELCAPCRAYGILDVEAGKRISGKIIRVK